MGCGCCGGIFGMVRKNGGTRRICTDGMGALQCVMESAGERTCNNLLSAGHTSSSSIDRVRDHEFTGLSEGFEDGGSNDSGPRL